MSPEQDQFSGNGNATLGSGVGIDGASSSDVTEASGVNVGAVSLDATDEVNGANVGGVGFDNVTGLAGDGIKETFDESASVSASMQSVIQNEQPMTSEQLPVTNNMESLQPIQQMQTTQQMQPMQSAQLMQFSQPMTPTSSGTGDIIIDGVKEPKDKKKLLLIIGAAAVGVTLLVLIIFGVSKLINGGVVASNAREAFNLYANYFLTGEVSKEDVEIRDSGDEADERLESETDEEVLREYPVEVMSDSEGVDDDDTDYVDIDPSSEDGDAVESVEREVINSEIADDSELYFNKVYYGEVENGNDYFEELKSFYLGFRDMYMEGINDEDEVKEYSAFFDDCYSQLELAEINYNNGRLSEQEILDAYNRGGRDVAEELINEKASNYQDYDERYGVDMAGFTMDYGKKELSLIERYANYGCVLNNEVDYGCVSSHPTEDDEAIALEVTESAMNLQDALDDCADNLFYYLYKMDDLVYEGEDVNIDEE